MNRFATTVLLAASLTPFTASAQQDLEANALQKLMLFRSFVQDDPSCALSVVEGRPLFSGATAANAPGACPDAFAWAQMAEAVSQGFWNWGIDQTVWPAMPLPLCSSEVRTGCCDPDAPIDPTAAPPAGCPVNRADYARPSPLPARPNGSPASGVINHGGLEFADRIDPGRLLRDLELELVFRNKTMIDYIYRQDLYSKEGLGARNRAQNAALANGDLGRAQALTVRFPADAVMVKADFLHQQIMLDQGLIQRTDAAGAALNPPNDPNFPYLTVWIEGDGSEGSVPGLYYLVAMTNASKALPIWHWYAIEHVSNRGRCDYIGCNDSFGYSVNGRTQAGADFGAHFIPPMIELNDDKIDQNDPLFVAGEVYDPAVTGETITPELAALLRGMGVGTAATDPDPTAISADDPAWMNYRLKGTQTTFTTAAGVPTGMGATVTEGGFVNSASCTTCHSQASVDLNGAAGVQGVGATWRPNLLGYQQVAMGAPEFAWFYRPGGPSIAATQIDFVWGIFNAHCQKSAENGSACASYPDEPTVVPAR
ncbi:hypothetical protein [Rubrimonas cliftonensis]|uniref:Cytochrome c domain-containing protein n=1 Tax=Rubrimonas cliftonensis TaxID=89524 RepID=A0A1H4FZE1_9RHOB|nr:hypothetical protein [Rubrimonas cliftonensis]SEB02746.1 hypothetical protein SAMN05444370_13221 [Rubrimonas cliftonensis]